MCMPIDPLTLLYWFAATAKPVKVICVIFNIIEHSVTFPWTILLHCSTYSKLNTTLADLEEDPVLEAAFERHTMTVGRMQEEDKKMNMAEREATLNYHRELLDRQFKKERQREELKVGRYWRFLGLRVILTTLFLVLH